MGCLRQQLRTAGKTIAIITRCFMRRTGKGSRSAVAPHRGCPRSTASPRPRASSFRCCSRTSPICSPTVMTGFRLVPGSWKIMPMRRAPGALPLPAVATDEPASRTRHTRATGIGQQPGKRQRRHRLPKPTRPTGRRFHRRRATIDAVDRTDVPRGVSMATLRPVTSSSGTGWSGVKGLVEDRSSRSSQRCGRQMARGSRNRSVCLKSASGCASGPHGTARQRSVMVTAREQ